MANPNPSRRGGLTSRTASQENVLRQHAGYTGSTANNSSNRGAGSNPSSSRGLTTRWVAGMWESDRRMLENRQRGSSGNSRPASSSRGGSHRRASFVVYPDYAYQSPQPNTNEYFLKPPAVQRPRNSRYPDRNCITPRAYPSRYEPDTPPPSAPGSSNGHSTDESMAEDEQAEVEVSQQLALHTHAAIAMAPQFDPSNQPPHNVDSVYYLDAVYPNSQPPSHCSQGSRQQRGFNYPPPSPPPPGQVCRIDQRQPSDFYASPSVYCMREPVTAQQSEYFMDHRITMMGLEDTPRAQCNMRWVDPNGAHPLDRTAVLPYSQPDNPTLPDSPGYYRVLDKNGGSRRVNNRGGHNGGYGNQPANTIYLGSMYRGYP